MTDVDGLAVLLAVTLIGVGGALWAGLGLGLALLVGGVAILVVLAS